MGEDAEQRRTKTRESPRARHDIQLLLSIVHTGEGEVLRLGVFLFLSPERTAGQRDLFLEPQIERLGWILEAIAFRFLIEDVGER